MGGGGQKVLWRWPQRPERLHHVGDLFRRLANRHEIEQDGNDREFRDLSGLMRIRNHHRTHALRSTMTGGCCLTTVDHALYVEKVAYQGD